MSLVGTVKCFTHFFTYYISPLCSNLLRKLIAVLFYGDLECVSYLKKLTFGFSNLEAQKGLKETALVPDSHTEKLLILNYRLPKLEPKITLLDFCIKYD